MTMDAKSLTAAVKELNEANAAGKIDVRWSVDFC